ncbi:hypothetical protein XF36_05910 [Pseudonocardia sp. HH130629-09]|nr:hypothetical protein XF36_05910 [Pseudonocardia sp. HH130629-09]
MGVAIVDAAVIGGMTVIGRAAVGPAADVVRAVPAPGPVRRVVAAVSVLLASAAAVVALGVVADVAAHGPAVPPAVGAPR